MKRILLSLIFLTNIFSSNALAAASESAEPKKAEVHLVMYSTSTVHTPGQETLITMTGNPGPCDVQGPFADLDALKEFISQQLAAFHGNEHKAHTILSFTALSADESDEARVGESTLIPTIMSGAEMAAQMALLNTAITSEGYGAIRAQIQF